VSRPIMERLLTRNGFKKKIKFNSTFFKKKKRGRPFIKQKNMSISLSGLNFPAGLFDPGEGDVYTTDDAKRKFRERRLTAIKSSAAFSKRLSVLGHVNPPEQVKEDDAMIANEHNEQQQQQQQQQQRSLNLSSIDVLVVPQHKPISEVAVATPIAPQALSLTILQKTPTPKQVHNEVSSTHSLDRIMIGAFCAAQSLFLALMISAMSTTSADSPVLIVYAILQAVFLVASIVYGAISSTKPLHTLTHAKLCALCCLVAYTASVSMATAFTLATSGLNPGLIAGIILAFFGQAGLLIPIAHRKIV